MQFMKAREPSGSPPGSGSWLTCGSGGYALAQHHVRRGGFERGANAGPQEQLSAIVRIPIRPISVW